MSPKYASGVCPLTAGHNYTEARHHRPLLCTSNSRFQRFRFLKSLTKSTSVPSYADPGCGPKSQLLSCNFKVTISDRDTIQLSRMESSEGRCRSNALIWCDTFIIFERHPPLLCTSNSRFQRFEFFKSLPKSTSVPSWLARE